MNRIAKLRKETGLKQSELAEKVGLSQQVISLYESGEHEPKLEIWQKLADFFGVSVSYLAGIDDEDHPHTIIDKHEKKTKFLTFIVDVEDYFNGIDVFKQARERLASKRIISIDQEAVGRNAVSYVVKYEEDE